MAYGDFKHFNKRTAADEVLCNETFDIAKNPKYDGYQRGLASIICNFFDKNPSGSDIKIFIHSIHRINQLIYSEAKFFRSKCKS